MFAIFKKELRSYFMNAIGFVYLGVFFALSAFLVCFTTILASTPTYNTSGYFTYMTMAFIILIPLLTMKLFSEEKKLRTEQLLLTAPVSTWGMVFGKFLAAFALFFGSIVVSLINFFPLVAYHSAENISDAYDSIGPVFSIIISCTVGLILIGAAFIAIGMFISSLTENQLAAAIITVAIILVMLLLNMVNGYIENEFIRAIINGVCFMSRFSNFSYGLLDPAALVYYASMTGVFLLFTVYVYDRRRWS